MAKELKIHTNRTLDATPVEKQEKGINKNVFYERIDSGVNQAFSLDNIPAGWNELKQEIAFLEVLGSKVEIALGSRLVHVRDNELFRNDGYENMTDYSKSLNISKSKAYALMAIYDYYKDFFQPAGKVKIENLVKSLPVVKDNEEKKEEIFNASQLMPKKEFISFLNRLQNKIIFPKEEESEDLQEWYTSKEELIANSKFLRDGMKPKTVKSMIRELVNLAEIEDPKNKTLEKIRKLLNNL